MRDTLRNYVACDAAEAVIAIAERHGVSYERTELDAFADDMTRLAGDDVRLDDVELLIVALRRAGHLDKRQAMRLFGVYRKEARVDVRPFR